MCPDLWIASFLFDLNYEFIKGSFAFSPGLIYILSFLGLREFFSRLSRHFFKRAREPEGKLRHVVYEIWLVSYLFFSFQIWYFRKWIITSMRQSKHMRVTRFNPLWVSDIIYTSFCIYTQILLSLLIFGGHCNRYFWDVRLKIDRLPNFNMFFQLVLTKCFKSELFLCLPKVDYVIN